jgi:serine/threonine protein kinase/predicted TPR repeat methyltransferase
VQLDHFQIKREIARGGMGVVYEAYDTLLQRPVAIKLIAHALPQRRERFQREIQALARLRHPHVVPVLSAGEHEGKPYVVMELIQGETLQERIEREGPLPGRQAAAMHRKLAEALVGAHASGILHRDLKPANVLIRADGEPLLTDFGLALDLSSSGSSPGERLSRDGTALGTPGYWPPEQAAGQLAKIGPASDVYGLGATLYTTLTGSPPFGEGLSGLAGGDAGRLPVAPSELEPGLDGELDAICLRCLAADPADRYPTAQRLARALSRYLQGRPGTPRPERQAPVAQAAAATLLVAGALGAGWVLRGGAPSPSPSSPVVVATPTEAPSPAVERSPEASPTLDASGRSAEEWFNAGKSLAASGDHAAALASFERARQLDATKPEVFIGLGNVHAELGDLPAALRAYRGALEADPTYAKAYMNRAVCQGRLGDWQAAVEELRAALRCLEPADPAHGRVLEMLAEAEERARSPMAFTGVVSGQADPAAEAALTEGNQRFQEGDLSGALAALTRAVELAPDFTEAYNNRGVVLSALGDLGAALRDFQRALELNPQHLQAYANRAQAHAAAGDPRAALEDWSRYLEARDEPLARYHRADAREKLGDYEGAVEDAARALELDPAFADAWDMRAVARVGLGDRSGAVEDWTRFLELRPGNLPALCNRGNVRAKMGDHEGAIADLSRALELMRPGDPMASRVQGVLRRVQEQAQRQEPR